jgi:glutathione S-transferase
VIEVHHLNNSRSQRVLWLLEELGLDYKIVKHTRDATTNLAPPSLLAVHALGKSPLIRDDGTVVIESGAILEYIVRKHGKGRLAPPESSPLWVRYLQLMHYAEGSAMLPVMLKLYMGRLGEAGKPLEPRIHGELDNHLGFLERELGDKPWFLGDELSAADIQLSFVSQAAKLLYGLDKFPKLKAFVARVSERPAWKRGLEKGGTYAFA